MLLTHHTDTLSLLTWLDSDNVSMALLQCDTVNVMNLMVINVVYFCDA